MPGFVIHIAVAKIYLEKHPNEIKKKEEFIKGILAPDLIAILNKERDKSNTHYGKMDKNFMKINLKAFLEDPKVNMSEDYWKGYFIHLQTDDQFYLHYFKKETEVLIKNNDFYYEDYDCLNKSLIKRYHIEKEIEETIGEYIHYIPGKPKYLKEDKVIAFIDEISNPEIEEMIKKV